MTNVVKLFYETAPGQNRLGFFGADDQVLEIWFNALHRPNLMGTVHQARIDRVFSAQNRAIAKLEDGEVISLRLRKHDKDSIIVGAVVMITITAAPRHGKPWQGLVGARLVSSEMILLVGVPDQTSIAQLSKNISGDQRQPLMARLLAEVEPVLPPGFGVILRRCGVDLADFGAKATTLIDLCKMGAKTLYTRNLGLVFDAGDLLTRAKRVVGNLPLIDDPAIAFERSTMLDDAIASAMLPICPLACGGHLWCEQTHAVWSIDIDGNGTTDLDKLCDEAADEIARQIRLRGMSGPVLIDAPRLPPVRARRFRANLQNALDDDLRQLEYLGTTRGGLLELRVPHGEMALDAVMKDRPAQDALAGLRLAMWRPGFHPVTMAVSSAMAEWLYGPGKAARDQLDKPLKLLVWPEESQDQIVHILDNEL